MSLFSDAELGLIKDKIRDIKGNLLITFRNRFGPTRLKELWLGHLEGLGIVAPCISWWSSSGTVGLLECESDSGFTVYGQWTLDDKNELIGVFDVSNEEIAGIREGFDAGNVTSSAMRALRIGETGDKD
ncbi:MAG: hypothetical protein JSW61_11375 [Candidatus Thorarchaeota archaeon]|nr:MAG: hypothetical protein JSW61_11375 [Candidatus Thorarchaeota archaeon]